VLDLDLNRAGGFFQVLQAVVLLVVVLVAAVLQVVVVLENGYTSINDEVIYL
jgi:hypothetical protein